MNVGCPTCGAAVEFRFDDSFVRVCGSCRSAVLRSDRGIETLGKLADLVPIDSPLRLFAEGRHGSATFLLIGMAQIKHAAGGVWQEWYAKLDGGQWAWLSEAQGRYYLTFEQPGAQVPPFQALAPGVGVVIGGRTYAVAEVGTGTYASATGEIPYKLDPKATFWFADLADGQGGFATIDYNDGTEPPSVYAGHQVTLPSLGLYGGEDPAAGAAAPRQGKSLACPNCGGSLALGAPDQTLRVACPYCNHLVSVQTGNLAVIAKLARRARPSIALGAKGKFAEGEMTVIGYMQRSALVEGTWYPFEEYLLHAPAIGFRWLVCSDGHWSYVQPVAPGAVKGRVLDCTYDGVAFRRFARAPLRVDQVLGEFYWQVHAGETVESEDFVAPPAMMSLERSDGEETWSLSTYMTVAEVAHAFGGGEGVVLGAPIGVGPNQVNDSARAGNYMTAGFGAMLVIGIVAAIAAPARLVYQHALVVHGKAKAAAGPATGATAGMGAGSAMDLGIPVPKIEDPCSRYLEALDAVISCDELPQEKKDALLAQQTGSTAACEKGIDEARGMLQGTTGCRVPEGIAGAGTGTGTGTGSGTGHPTSFRGAPLHRGAQRV